METTRDQLERECQGCPYCGGNGMAIVFHPDHSGSRESTNEWGRKLAMEVSAHCRCKIGVWMRERTDPALQRRIPWIKDILDGRSIWMLNPPGETDEVATIPTQAEINRQFGPMIKQTPESIAEALRRRNIQTEDPPF